VRKLPRKHVQRDRGRGQKEEIEEAGRVARHTELNSSAARGRAINPGQRIGAYDYLASRSAPAGVVGRGDAYEPVATKVMLDARLAACGRWIDADRRSGEGPPGRSARAAIADEQARFRTPRLSSRQTTSRDSASTTRSTSCSNILMRDKAWSDELARKTYVAILETDDTRRAVPRRGAGGRRARWVAAKVNIRRRPTVVRKVTAQSQHGAF